MAIDEAALIVRAKAELRKRLRALRQTTPASACAARSERIVTRLLEMSVVASAKSVALFWPMEERHEVDLRALDAALRARGVDVAYPAIEGVSQTMSFRFAAPHELVAGALGARGAPSSAPEARSLDVIVVPAIAVDAQGRRLGYGAGYYDHALRHHIASITIGVVFDFQLLVEVPAAAHDVSVRWIVTDARTLNCAELSP